MIWGVLSELKDKTVKIKSEITDETIEIEYDDLKHFDLAYCITCHCAQGSSFNFEYSIYEWQFFDKSMLYVAISRARQRSFVNFKNEVQTITVLHQNDPNNNFKKI